MRAVALALLTILASPGLVAADDELATDDGDQVTVARRKTRAELDEEAFDRLRPPSLEPKAYRAWLRALPKKDQRLVARLCRKNPIDFRAACGGIGPLHIPVPPRPAFFPGEERDPLAASAFESYEAWWASLSGGQKGYFRQHCPDRDPEELPSSDLCGLNTPLVLSFDGAPVTFREGATFAFAPGVPVATDWPTAATPWLALDRDGDGAITSGAELFGGDTILPGGARARHGFEALAALDTNHDGRVDAADPAFADLHLWRDADGDGASAPTELTAAAPDLVAIDLAYTATWRCDARGNCEGERARFTWRDANGHLRAGAIVDVYLPAR